jgi:hypothetical protein
MGCSWGHLPMLLLVSTWYCRMRVGQRGLAFCRTRAASFVSGLRQVNSCARQATPSVHTGEPNYRTLEPMTATDVLFALSGGGLVLSTLFFVAECMRWQTQQTADRKTARRMRALYAKLFSIASIRRSARRLVAHPLTKFTGEKSKRPR